MKIPPPFAPVAKAAVREVLHVSVTRWLATAIICLVLGAPLAVHSPGPVAPEPTLPSPLEPAVPLLEASTDAGLPFLASVVMGSLPKPGPNQKREGDCDPGKAQVAINGGCWVQTTTPPPCPDGKQWQHEGRCWLPVGPTVRPPTAGEPRPFTFADP